MPWPLAVALALAVHFLSAPNVSAQPAFINVSNVVEWRNFIWIASCKTVVIGRPTNVSDVVAAIASGSFGRVKAVGTGLSFNGWTCPAPVALGAKPKLILDMTLMNRILELDTAASTVSVEAGVRVGDLSRWLFSKGYALKTFSRQVNVTVAGAMCTASHGSSVLHGTFSSTVEAVEVVLANGTVVTIDAASRSKKLGVSYLPAFRASLGRLGVITKVVVSVEKDYPVLGTLSRLSVQDFISTYLEKKLTQQDLEEMEADNFFYQPNANRSMPFLKTHTTKVDTPAGRALADPGRGFYNQTTSTTLPSFIPADVQAIMLNETLMKGIRASRVPNLSQKMFEYFLQEGATPSLSWKSVGEVAYYQASLATRILLPLRPGPGGFKIDIYEVAVQMKDAKRCLSSIHDLVYSDPVYADSLYACMQIRFVKDSKPVLLSPTQGKLAMYIDLDAYWYDDQGRQFYMQWNRIIDLMTGPDCNGIMHWGLSGPWELYSRTTKQALKKPLKKFKAIANELDPEALFASELDRFFF